MTQGLFQRLTAVLFCYIIMMVYYFNIEGSMIMDWVELTIHTTTMGADIVS
jgi:hypothetical protein